MTKVAVVAKLAKAGVVLEKSKRRGRTSYSGSETFEKIVAVLGAPTDKPKNYLGVEYDRWVFGDTKVSWNSGLVLVW